jgi:hypothetical protein
MAGLSEVCEEAADSVGDGIMSFDLAGPAALDGILSKLNYWAESRNRRVFLLRALTSWCVIAGETCLARLSPALRN